MSNVLWCRMHGHLLDHLLSFVGLQIATFLVRVKSLSEDWSEKVFSGVKIYHTWWFSTFLRKFAAQCDSTQKNSLDVAIQNPLWHLQISVNHFSKKDTTVAVPTGVISFIKSQSCWEDLARARFFLNIKHICFCIWLLADEKWNFIIFTQFQITSQAKRMGLLYEVSCHYVPNSTYYYVPKAWLIFHLSRQRVSIVCTAGSTWSTGWTNKGKSDIGDEQLFYLSRSNRAEWEDDELSGKNTADTTIEPAGSHKPLNWVASESGAERWTSRNFCFRQTYLSVASAARRRGLSRSKISSARLANDCGFIFLKNRIIVTF